MERQKVKYNTRKNKVKEINQKVLEKEGRLRRYRQSVKQYRKSRKFQNNEGKFYPQVGGETVWFLKQIWQPREHNKKSRMNMQYDKRIKRARSRPESRDIDMYLSRELKKLWNINVTIILIVIGAFGTVTKELLMRFENLDLRWRVETI